MDLFTSFDINGDGLVSRKEFRQVLPLLNLPKYGFGDATSYRLCGDAVKATLSSGAVRHGAECFNFYFPQELDDEYLVVWEGLTAITLICL